MNGAGTKTYSGTLDQLSDLWSALRSVNWKRVMNRFWILAIGFLFLFLLILMKSKTTVDFAIEPWLYGYTILVTAFQLSRIASAMLYERTSSEVYADSKVQKSTFAESYAPSVSVVIPCKNEENDIAKTVMKCFEADYSKEQLEVIVVNDGSTDRTGDVLRILKKHYPSLQVIDWQVNRGKRHAMAEGFRAAMGEIVVQLDSDSWIHPATFHSLIAPFRNPEIGAVCGHADPENAQKNLLTKMQAAYYFMSFRILKAAESTFASVFCCSGCSSAYRKDLVLPILDEWTGEMFLGKPVTWGDDRSLTSWVLRSGAKTFYSDRVQAYTIVPEKLRKFITQQVRWKKSWIINAIFTSKFIFRSQPIVGIFYFLPLILISFLTPFMTLRALVYLPLWQGVWPLYHIAGILIITTLFAAYYRLLTAYNKYWPYLFLWSLFNIAILSVLMFWAILRIQDRGWGTR